MTLFDKLSQTIKLVSRGLRTVSPIIDSYLILSRKKLSSHAKELFGPSMGSFLRFLIPGFMCRFIFLCIHFMKIWRIADTSGVASGQNGVARTKAALPLIQRVYTKETHVWVWRVITLSKLSANQKFKRDHLNMGYGHHSQPGTIIRGWA